MKNNQESLILELQKHVGERNAKTASEMGYEGPQFRRQVNKLRRKGFPICSSNKGYWWAGSVEEVNNVKAALSGRIESMRKAIAGLEKWKAEMELSKTCDGCDREESSNGYNQKSLF